MLELDPTYLYDDTDLAPANEPYLPLPVTAQCVGLSEPNMYLIAQGPPMVER